MRKRKDGECGQASSGHCVLTEEKKEEVQWPGKLGLVMLVFRIWRKQKKQGWTAILDCWLAVAGFSLGSLWQPFGQMAKDPFLQHEVFSVMQPPCLQNDRKILCPLKPAMWYLVPRGMVVLFSKMQGKCFFFCDAAILLLLVSWQEVHPYHMLLSVASISRNTLQFLVEVHAKWESEHLCMCVLVVMAATSFLLS